MHIINDDGTITIDSNLPLDDTCIECGGDIHHVEENTYTRPDAVLVHYDSFECWDCGEGYFTEWLEPEEGEQ